jgi:hypothetical protein
MACRARACHRSRSSRRADGAYGDSMRVRSIRGESVTKQRRSHRRCPQRGTAVWCERDGDRASTSSGTRARNRGGRSDAQARMVRIDELLRVVSAAGRVFRGSSFNLQLCRRPVCAIQRPTPCTRSAPSKDAGRWRMMGGAAPEQSVVWRNRFGCGVRAVRMMEGLGIPR